jgi:hypothetical protein
VVAVGKDNEHQNQRLEQAIFGRSGGAFMPDLSDNIQRAQQDRDRSEADLAFELRAAQVAEQTSKLALLL